MSKPQTFISELRSRNVRKTMTIYLSSALTIIGVVKLFIDAYGLSGQIFPVIVTILTCGTISAFIFAWYHGKSGAQRFQAKEITLQALVLIVAAVFTYRVASTPPSIVPQRLGKSIAVLPFKNMSESKEDEYFSDGITEDILTQLSKIAELKVISRTTIMKYKNTQKSIMEIAAELGVVAILEGSVRRSGDRVRIVGQLINAEKDEHVWAETYDREFKDIFAIQSEVAKEIAAVLKAKLSPDERQRIEKKATANLDAYAYYLRGRDHYNMLLKDENERAIEFFKKAIALDSSYALAFAGLADAYAQRYQRFGAGGQWIDSSIALSQHAVRLDPDIPEPYKSLGLAYYQREWYTRAMEQNRKALELNPNYASVYSNMGELLDWTGHQDEAVVLVKKAMRLQPGRIGDYVKLGLAYYSLGMDSLSMANIMKAIELQPSYVTSYATLADLYASRGDLGQARSLLDSLLANDPEDLILTFAAGNIELNDHQYEKARTLYQRVYDRSPDYFALLAPFGFTLLKTGRATEGNRILDLCKEANLKAIENQSEEAHRRYDLAHIAAIRKDTLSALEWLGEALTRNPSFSRLAVMDPLMENINGTVEFKHLIMMNRQKIVRMRERVEMQESEP
ncbi:MAG: tetratricopeptide repeat protein [Bacteroidota bacterium]